MQNSNIVVNVQEKIFKSCMAEKFFIFKVTLS